MMLLVIQLLLGEIPFEIPETLIYKPPESVFVERKEITASLPSKIFSLLLSTQSIEVRFPWASLRRTQLPIKSETGKISKTSLEFNFEKKHFNLFAIALEKEYGNFANIEDSVEACFVWESSFVTFKFKNWLDYFPTVREGRIKLYVSSHAAIGYKINNTITPYLAFDFFDEVQKIYAGLAFFTPHGFAGLQIRERRIDAIFLNFIFNNVQFNFKFDGSEYRYGILSHCSYIPFDSLLLLRKPYKSSTVKTDLYLPPFYLGFERLFFKTVTVQNPSDLRPVEVENFCNYIYNFGIKTESFSLIYTHFESPYPVTKDTLTLTLFFSEKYYDVALYFNLRNHKETFNMVNLELILKTFKNVSPYLRVVNLFDNPGEYLPTIKAKRRYVEIGCQFQREI